MQLDLSKYLDLELLASSPKDGLGVAVSGGGDSVALLHLLHAWAGRSLHVITVDHGLRDESAAEAEAVGTLAASMNLSHTTLQWAGWNRRGNLQEEARTARRSLIADWAIERGLSAVALGHTADDQAETFLMRLARGSGVDGLSAMSPFHEEAGVGWIRPMLHVRREELRSYLSELGAKYFDDPSNDDASYDRIKVRQALGTLGALGIDVPKITKTTQRLRSAKQVMFAAARDLSLASTELNGAGELKIDLERFNSGQPAIKLRILSEALRFVSGSYYAPRAFSVETIVSDLSGDFSDATLHGCVMRKKGMHLIVRREPGRTGEPVKVGRLWDNRWKITGPNEAELLVSDLGFEGLKSLPKDIERCFPHEALLTTPAVWKGDELQAAPLAGWGNGWSAELCPRSPFFNQ